MLQILSDKLLRGDLTDLARLKDVVLQGKVARRSNIVPAGSYFASAYAARNLSRNCAIGERLGGITQVRLFDKLAADFDPKKGEIAEKLARIRQFFQASGRLTASFVGAQESFRKVREHLAGLLGELRDETPPIEPSGFSPALGAREGIATPADVAFVARAFPVVGADHEAAPALFLLSTHLSFGYLWDQIRVRGGAYGAQAAYNWLNGIFTFSSYRDPFIKETLEAYDGVAGFVLERMDLSPKGVEQAIIGTVKRLDRPIRPGEAVGAALSRHLVGETPEFRKKFRSRLLALKGDDIRRACAEILAPAFRSSPICVLSSREKLTTANQTLGERSLDIADL
jgi:Zn-dependent M16 (insulinase) family peptidase